MALFPITFLQIGIFFLIRLIILIFSLIIDKLFMIRPIVLSGPSGGGKSTILNRAIKEYPNTFEFSISRKKNYNIKDYFFNLIDTTRKPRDGEIDGQHYHFTDVKTMRSMIKNKEFFEYAEFGGNLYGTR